jgi:ribosomal protein L30/L7E
MSAWNPKTLGQLAKYTRVVKPVPRLVEVMQVKSGAKATRDIQQTLRALNLDKMNKSIIHKNISPIRGMINKVLLVILLMNKKKVKHYVRVQEVAIPKYPAHETILPYTFDAQEFRPPLPVPEKEKNYKPIPQKGRIKLKLPEDYTIERILDGPNEPKKTWKEDVKELQKRKRFRLVGELELYLKAKDIEQRIAAEKEFAMKDAKKPESKKDNKEEPPNKEEPKKGAPSKEAAKDKKEEPKKEPPKKEAPKKEEPKKNQPPPKKEPKK